jgi:dCMP deaminase
MRKPWDQYFMEQALHIAERATCNRARVGCILVRDNRIIAAGYNGSLNGAPHCDDVGHLMDDNDHCIRTVHSEQNALLQCAKFGISSEGATAYVTHEPCTHCRKSLIQAGVKKVIFLHPYPNQFNPFFTGNVTWKIYTGEADRADTNR